MAENIVIATYEVESEAYQALSEIKHETTNANYTISQAMIVKKENGKYRLMSETEVVEQLMKMYQKLTAKSE